MTRLITKARVACIAYPRIDMDSMVQWAVDHGLVETMRDEDTPLAKLMDAADSSVPGASVGPLIEFAGRQCYRAFKKGRPHQEYVDNIIESGHGSVLAHANFSFALSGISRSLSLELNRHGIGTAISQESQRYVDAKDIKFVVPPLLRALFARTDAAGTFARESFEKECERNVEVYEAMQEACMVEAAAHGFTGTELKKRVNEAARSVLPNCAETRMVWSANVRALRHICSLRGAEGADLEIRDFAVMLLKEVRAYAPSLFSDFEVVAGQGELPPTTKTSYPKV